jgi:hypothetical protein
MSETIVTNEGSTVIVDTSIVQNVVTADSVSNTTIVTGIMGPAGASTMAQLQDINKTGLVNGATLVYNADSLKWDATRLLNNQILEAGQF